MMRCWQFVGEIKGGPLGSNYKRRMILWRKKLVVKEKRWHMSCN